MARLVLIDDHASLRAVMTEMLTDGGHTVVDAAGGLEGLAVLRRERPDLVLCDIHMPDLDGFGVLRAIRSDPQLATLPFVFLTSEAEVRAGMESGADDYLMKPVSQADLLAAVEARLARRETTRREGERRIEEMRRTVVALLPHEIRTPLTTIMGSARLMQEFHGDFGAMEIEQMATGILKAAQRLHRMAENYILHADLEMQRLSASSGDRPSAGFAGAADVQAAARETAAQRGRTEDLDLVTDDVTAPLASAYLRKVTSELCDNAFKFSEAGQRVGVALTASAEGTRLRVTDQGRGMTAEQVREVGTFRQFDRGRYEQQGSGVGLALVRSIAEVSGGSLELSAGGGTIACVRWPTTQTAG